MRSLKSTFGFAICGLANCITGLHLACKNKSPKTHIRKTGVSSITVQSVDSYLSAACPQTERGLKMGIEVKNIPIKQ